LASRSREPQAIAAGVPPQRRAGAPVRRMQAAGGTAAAASRGAAGSSGAGLGPAVHVLTACNAYRQETVLLERSAARHGYGFRALGLGGPWRGLGTKLAIYERALSELVGNDIAPEDVVVLLDAWDTVLLGPAAELRGKLGAMGLLEPGGWVLCAADRLCAPEYKLAPRMERLYPRIATPWRYPNSGGFAGTAEALRAFLRSLVHGPEGGGFSEDGDDQLRVQTFLLACAEQGSGGFPLVLDEDCSVFQCMGEPECGWDYEPAPSAAGSGRPAVAPRIRNWTTGERPLVAHGCGGHGRWFLADVYRELQLLDYLGVREADLQGLKHAGLVPPGHEMTEEFWVEQPPWDFPFQLFGAIRAAEWQKLLQQELFEEFRWEPDPQGRGAG